MLVMAIALLAFSLSFNRRGVPHSLPPPTPRHLAQRRQRQQRQQRRRAPLAENGWEERVLHNLTQADPSWE